MFGFWGWQAKFELLKNEVEQDRRFRLSSFCAWYVPPLPPFDRLLLTLFCDEIHIMPPLNTSIWPLRVQASNSPQSDLVSDEHQSFLPCMENPTFLIKIVQRSDSNLSLDVFSQAGGTARNSNNMPPSMAGIRNEERQTLQVQATASEERSASAATMDAAEQITLIPTNESGQVIIPGFSLNESLLVIPYLSHSFST